MKHLLLVALLATAAPALAQTAPPKDAAALIIQTSDSAQTAYRQVVRTLLVSGYGIDRQYKEMMAIKTQPKLQPKSAVGVVYLKIVAITTPESSGATTTFRAMVTVTNARAAHLEVHDLPVRYAGPGTNTMQLAWAELARVASLALPTGRVEYQ